MRLGNLRVQDDITWKACIITSAVDVVPCIKPWCSPCAAHSSGTVPALSSLCPESGAQKPRQKIPLDF